MKKDKKPPLNFRFHNPNSDIDTLDLIISVFMDVNKKKAKEAVDKELEEIDKKGINDAENGL